MWKYFHLSSFWLKKTSGLPRETIEKTDFQICLFLDWMLLSLGIVINENHTLHEELWSAKFWEQKFIKQNLHCST